MLNSKQMPIHEIILLRYGIDLWRGITMRTFMLIAFMMPIVLAGCLPVITKEIRLQPDGSGALATDTSTNLQEWAEVMRSMGEEYQNKDTKELMKLTADYLDQQALEFERSILGDLKKLPSYVRRLHYTAGNIRHWGIEMDFKNRDDAERKLRAILKSALPPSQATDADEQELEQMLRELLTEPDPFFTSWKLQRKENEISFTVTLSALTSGQLYRVVLPGQLVSATEGQVQRTPQGDAIIWEGDLIEREVSAVWHIAQAAGSEQPQLKAPWSGKAEIPPYVST
jgi:hypothetical protein